MIRQTINAICEMLLVISIVGMWVTLGKAIWLFFMILSLIAIIVFFINGG